MYRIAAARTTRPTTVDKESKSTRYQKSLKHFVKTAFAQVVGFDNEWCNSFDQIPIESRADFDAGGTSQLQIPLQLSQRSVNRFPMCRPRAYLTQRDR